MIDTDSLDAVCVVATEERADHIEEGFPGGGKGGAGGPSRREKDSTNHPKNVFYYCA